MAIFSAIDIGSNAIRLAIVECTEGAGTKQPNFSMLSDVREPIRVGADVFGRGVISNKTETRVVEALRSFLKLCAQYEGYKLRVIATSAVREASNRKEFLHRVEKECGITIEVIDGVEEARLVYEAVQGSVDMTSGAFLLFDIGGGSVEISLAQDGAKTFSRSLKLGTLRLLELSREKGMRHLSRMIQRSLAKVIVEIQKRIASLSHSTLTGIGTGGNIESLGKLRVRTLKKENRDEIYAEELTELRKLLVSLSYQERIDTLHLKTDRADVIVPATLVVEELLRCCAINRMVIPRVGLKEGVIVDMICNQT